MDAGLFSIYPNPNKGVFILEIMNDEYRMMDLECSIFDVLGREVHNSKIVNRKSKIDLSGYPGGVYDLKVVTDNGVVNGKIVIE